MGFPLSFLCVFSPSPQHESTRPLRAAPWYPDPDSPHHMGSAWRQGPKSRQRRGRAAADPNTEHPSKADRCCWSKPFSQVSLPIYCKPSKPNTNTNSRKTRELFLLHRGQKTLLWCHPNIFLAKMGAPGPAAVGSPAPSLPSAASPGATGGCDRETQGKVESLNKT